MYSIRGQRFKTSPFCSRAHDPYLSRVRATQLSAQVLPNKNSQVTQHKPQHLSQTEYTQATLRKKNYPGDVCPEANLKKSCRSVKDRPCANLAFLLATLCMRACQHWQPRTRGQRRHALSLTWLPLQHDARLTLHAKKARCFAQCASPSNPCCSSTAAPSENTPCRPGPRTRASFTPRPRTRDT